MCRRATALGHTVEACTCLTKASSRMDFCTSVNPEVKAACTPFGCECILSGSDGRNRRRDTRRRSSALRRCSRFRDRRGDEYPRHLLDSSTHRSPAQPRIRFGRQHGQLSAGDHPANLCSDTSDLEHDCALCHPRYDSSTALGDGKPHSDRRRCWAGPSGWWLCGLDHAGCGVLLSQGLAENVVALLDQVYREPALIAVFLGGLLYNAGLLITSVAVWRSGAFPR